MTTHKMVKIHNHPDGGDVFQCKDCERRAIVHWRPFSREILVAGDECIHVGTAGVLADGLKLNVKAELVESEEEISKEDDTDDIILDLSVWGDVFD